jgi:hypothetical protein
MKVATAKSLAAKFAITSLAVGAFFLASPAKSQAQQFAVSARFGQPVYVADHDGYRDRDDYRQRVVIREREAREAYLRRQAYLQHEQWERSHRFDRGHDYR